MLYLIQRREQMEKNSLHTVKVGAIKQRMCVDGIALKNWDEISQGAFIINLISQTN